MLLNTWNKKIINQYSLKRVWVLIILNFSPVYGSCVSQNFKWDNRHSHCCQSHQMINVLVTPFNVVAHNAYCMWKLQFYTSHMTRITDHIRAINLNVWKYMDTNPILWTCSLRCLNHFAMHLTLHILKNAKILISYEVFIGEYSLRALNRSSQDITEIRIRL